MAINLSGLLGGLGEGFGQYDAIRRQKEQDKRAQEALDRQNRGEDRLLKQSEYNQGLGIFNQIQEIARADADDDVQTSRFLRTPGLDDAGRQQEVSGRLTRHEQRKSLIERLSSQGKVKETFGDITGIIRPTQFGTPNFQMPKPMIDPAQLKAMTDAELLKITKAPAAQKPAAVAQARQRLGYYADTSYLDANIPEFGKSMGFGGPRQPARKLENPDQFFQQNAGFTPGVGGERVLKTGAKQVVKYIDGVPHVEYQPALTADYVSPEAESLRSGVLSKQLDFLTQTMSPRVQAEFAKTEKLKWNNLLSEKAYNWFDKTQQAKIDKLRQRGSGASDALRRMSILLAHQDRMAALGQREKEFGLAQTKEWNDAQFQFDANIKSLGEERRSLVIKAGQSQDSASGAARAAALQGIKAIDEQIAALNAQGARVKSLDLNAANQVLGGQFTPASNLDPTTMLADQQQRQTDALTALQMGALRPTQAPAPVVQQAPAQAPFVFNPVINAGPTGGFPMAGGGGYPAPGGGGVMGGPGVLGGAGGGPQWPGGGGNPPVTPTTNATYEQTLKGLKGRFPNLPDTDIQQYARNITNVPSSRETVLLTLAQRDANVKKAKENATPADANGNVIDKDGRHFRMNGKDKIYVDPVTGRDLPPPKAPQIGPPQYIGYIKDGKPYTGQEYNGYAMSRSDYISAVRSGKSIEKYKLQRVDNSMSPAQLRELQSRQRGMHGSDKATRGRG